MWRKVVSIVIIILLILPVIQISTVRAENNTTSILTLPRITLVPLWSVSHDTYLAKFTDNKVFVFNSHGDVSLDGRYVSSYRNCYIYDIATGKLLGQYSGGTYDLRTGEKVWGRSGFFSADGRRMVEDVDVYGTDARVVDTKTWTTIPIDFGFTDTTIGHFYACQLDYDGDILVAGYMSASKMLVFKYDASQNKYVKIFEVQKSGHYGRRLQMTLDGKYILIGGLYYRYVDIWKWTGSTYELIAQIDTGDDGGVGALGISDPWNVGYIAIGTYNGWIVIAKFENDTVQVIYQEKIGDDGCWFYNPFYDRWIPKFTEIFAFSSHRDSSRRGIYAVYDILTNKAFIVKTLGAGSPSFKASAISPDGKYVFLGDTLYTVVRRDVQSGHPRIRFWGDLIYNDILHYSSRPFTVTAPARDWHLYIFSGNITIKKVIGTGISRSLVSASFRSGDFNTIRKYVDGKPISGWGISTELYDRRENPDLKVVSLLFHSRVTTVYLEGYTVVATWIDVPLHNHLSIYSKVYPIPIVQTEVAVPFIDRTKPPKDVISAFGDLILGFEVGGGVGGGGYTVAKIFSYVMKKKGEFLARQVVDAVEHLRLYSGTMSALDKAELTANILSWRSRAVRYLTISSKLSTVGKVLGWAGIAITVWQIMDSVYSWWGEYVLWVVNHGIFFTLTDEEGNKYLVGDVYCSDETFNDANFFIKQLPNLFSDYRICVKARVIASSNKELIEKIKKGDYPDFELVSVAKSRIEYEYNIPVEKLRVTGFKIITFTFIKSRQGLLTYFKGGINILPQISYKITGIDVKGTLKKQTFTTPDELYSVMNYIIINNEKYPLKKTDKGLVARFGFSLGVDSLTIEFPVENAHVQFDLKAEVCLKKDFEEVGNYGYTVYFHYDYPYRIIIKRIEFIDVPYPLKYLERIEHIAMGKFVDDLTKYVVYNSSIDDPNSPTGKRYSYVIMNRKGILVIDPANGGTMQPCKRYHFNYYYTEPPDVSLQLFLNGTSKVSSLPQHVAVILRSGVSQTVEYELTINVYVHDKIVHTETIKKNVTVNANEPYYDYYNITYYVDLARRYYNETSFIEFIGKILEAEYDYKKANDYDRIVYYVPLNLKKQYPSSLTLFVYDSATGQAVGDAYVKISNETTVLDGYTDTNGYITFDGLTTGYYHVHVSKSGYYDYSTGIFVNGTTSLNVPLVPVGYENYVPPPENGTSKPPLTKEGVKYWWLSVQVVYNDGAPFHGALVKIINLTDNSVIAELETNGTGFVHYLLPDGANVRVVVNATNPENASEFVTFERDVTVTQHYYLVFRVPWTSKYFEPEVSIVRVTIYRHEGLGYYFGNVSHLVELVLWSNVEQSVTVKLVLYNVTESGNVTIATKELSLQLHKGVNINWTWFDVNATYGSYVMAYANITQYQYDTDPTNNEAWSNVVRLKPYFNARIMVYVEPVKQKVPWAILPEDEIKVAVLIEFNMNVSKLKLSMHAFMHDLKKRGLTIFEEKVDEMSSRVAGKVWRNFTLTVPWTDRLEINITLLNEYDIYPFDNNATVTVDIDPDVKLEQVILEPSRPMYSEGELVTVTAKYKSNTLTGSGEVGIYDETLKEGIKSQAISKLQPEFEVKVTFKLPENPEVEVIPYILRMKEPLTTHLINVTFVGTDYYLDNNYKAFEVKVTSKQALYLGIGIILVIFFVILFLVVVAKLLKTVAPSRPRKYIKLRH